MSSAAAPRDALWRFDSRSPCLVLAPHLDYPLRNGADILIDRRWSAFSRLVPFVDIVGRQTVVRYTQGDPCGRRRFRNPRVPRSLAAARALCKNGHYLHEKLLTSEFCREARERAASERYRTIVFSLICTSTLWSDLAAGEALACVETHNDEFKWFADLRRQTSNPLAKIVAAASEAWLLRHLRRDSGRFVYLHVSREDQEGYARRNLCPRSVIAPAGVEVNSDDRSTRPIAVDERSPLVLTFVGALSVNINRDALRTFADRYFPGLREAFGSQLVIRVVGSSPSRTVRKLCRRHQWQLFADVSEAELHRLLFETTFAILPFAYSTGLKLKLLVALGHGVPVLGTAAIASQLPALPSACLISDSPQEWIRHLMAVRHHGSISAADRRALLTVSRSFSWDSVARGVHDQLATL